MRIITRFAILTCVFTFAVAAFAGGKPPEGQTLYKANCLVCHDKGSPNGEYTPSSLIGDQWDSFFKTKLASDHKDAVVPNSGNKKLLDILSPEELKVLHKFCVDHAADSEQPLTCG